jgi:hypothetical protein
MQFAIEEEPLAMHLGWKLAEALRDFHYINAYHPKRIVMDIPHMLAFRQMYTPNVLPGEDIGEHRPLFHGIPVAYSKSIEGILLEE